MDMNNLITLCIPIIRDALLQELYPAYDGILQTEKNSDEFPTNYVLSIILRAITYVKSPQLLGDLAMYAKGLNEAAYYEPYPT